MNDQLTYRAITDRCEQTAKEIVSEIACFETAREANTFDGWQEYLDALESVEDEANDHAHKSVDSWDWCIYTYYGMGICQTVDISELWDAESEYADIWNEAPDGLHEYASRLAYLILHRKLTEAITEEVETCRELAEALQENCLEEGPEDEDSTCGDCIGTGESFPGVKCKTCEGKGES
jgi:hypothetical protein